MVMNKIRIAALFIVVIGLVAAGAGVLTYNPQAAQPQPPPLQKADGGQKLKDLLKKRLEAARSEFDSRNHLFDIGKGTEAELFPAGLRLLEAELALAEGRRGRIAVHEAHVRRMQKIAEDLGPRFKVGTIGPAEMGRADFYHLDAEIRLEHEKAK